MSAYAMPGAFPPVSGFTSTYNIGTESVDSPQQQQVRHPQHYELRPPPLQFKPVSFNSIRSTPIAPDSPLTPPSKKPVDQCEVDGAFFPRDVGILVKDATIDVAQLVKSLTTSSTKSRSRDILPPQIPVEPAKASSSDEHEDDPHKEAIQFELSISFNGRTYSATRTLPNIVQLRNDLIAEINNRRQSLRERRMRWIQRRIMDQKAAAGGRVDFDDDDTVQTVDEDEALDVTIPELPKYFSSEERNVGGSFAGRGFTLLHALLKSYCPAMEGWLRKVTVLVPPMDSPSWSQFLWEPVSCEVKMPTGESNHSFATLVSIKEDDEVDDDEELFETSDVSDRMNENVI